MSGPSDGEKLWLSLLGPSTVSFCVSSLRRFVLRVFVGGFITLSTKIAQKPYIIGSLGPKASKYESFEGKG